jgi:hypothetical protein
VKVSNRIYSDVSDDVPLPGRREIAAVTRDDALPAEATIVSTRDREVIRDWVTRAGAAPATGEATRSGPATSLDVQDLGSSLRRVSMAGVLVLRVCS